MQIISTFEGVDRVLAGFRHMDRDLSDLSPFWEKFAAERYEEEKRLFENAPWPALSSAYEARKAAIFGGPTQILVATGTLKRSLTEKDAPGNVHRIEKQFGEIGSSVSYGVFHIPKRDPRAEPNENRYQTIADEQLNEMIKEAGFN